MYCSKCGSQNDDNAFKCLKCGEIIQQIGPATASSNQQVPSHLAWAILATLLCCLPLGVPAIVFAAQVNGKLAAGDYQSAVKASRNAKTWCWVAFATGLVIMLIGMLSAIAIPQFSAYRMRSYNAAAEADLRNAVTAQETYYVDNETYADSVENLMSNYGFSPSQDVTLEIISADKDNYHMVAFHKQGNKKIQITGPGGVIEEYSE